MAGRTFAQINCSLLKSRKMKGLSHAERWVYVCAHLTPLSSFTGVFHYPAVMWASDADLAVEDLALAVGRLQAIGLVEWDPEEEVVRIAGFHRQRPPENASRSMSLVADFTELLRRQESSVGLVLRGAAEFAVAAIERSRSWKPESSEIPKLREVVGSFLRATYQEHEDAFLDALTDELAMVSKAARSELCSLLHPLAMRLPDTVSTPCRDRVGTRDVDDTRRDLDKDRYGDENETPLF